MKLCYRLIPAALCVLIALSSSSPAMGGEQVNIDRIEQMPNLPKPFKILDWKKIAIGYDRLAFDLNAKGEYLPLVWMDKSKKSGVSTFGMPTYVGPTNHAEHNHEAVATIASVLGSSLAGIDKRGGNTNWVDMCEAYFLTDPKERVVINRTSGESGQTFWYDTFAQVMFCGLVDTYPDAKRLAEIMRINADRWHDACVALGAREGKLSFAHTGFRFSDMQPYDNGRRTEPEGAVGAAWVQYMAYRKFGDKKHLEGADWCMKWLLDYPKNPYYEVVLCYAPVLAARMNVEEGRSYDVTKIINWCMGPSTARPGWGVILGKWGDYDVSGLSGSTTDGGGYAFAMNTFVATGAMLPVARYDDRYARAMGKFALNAINAARLFYPNEVPKKLQSCPDWKGDPEGVVCYEGLRRLGLNYARGRLWHQDPRSKGKMSPAEEMKWDGIEPYASGDPTPFGWEYKTDFALYGAGHVGMFAAIIGRTDDPRILRLNLLPTDYFHAKAYPTSLLYNPYDVRESVRIDVGESPVDVYDTVEKKFLARSAQGNVVIEIAPDSARVIVLATAGGKETRIDGKLLIDGIVVDHRIK